MLIDLFFFLSLGNLATSDGMQRRYNVLQSSSAYNANELWFKAAAIAFPIFGAVILFALIALAIRILKTDNFQTTTSKLGGITGNGLASSQQKSDLDAYGAASTAVNIGPIDGDQINCQTSITSNSKSLLMHHHQHHRNHIDKKNEQFAQKKHISSLEYHLLPQNCYDATLKPNNLDISNQSNCAANIASDIDVDDINHLNATNNLYRILVNFNYSPLQSNNNRTTLASSDNNSKIYEKKSINSTNYWMLTPNSNQLAAKK